MTRKGKRRQAAEVHLQPDLRSAIESQNYLGSMSMSLEKRLLDWLILPE